MINPVSTYRIQFHKDFTFRHLKNILPYLDQMGIKTIYAAPIFKAVPGSVHGYDIVDPNMINPEIGTLKELLLLKKDLKKRGMLWIQDIVPNHMAFHQENKWLMDVLKKGRKSQFATVFDINWHKEEKLMVPFLGAGLNEVILNKELKIVNEHGEYLLKYYDNIYPVNKETSEELNNSKKSLEVINSHPDLLQKICDEQHYRLCQWQETDVKINYRRFFTINGLISLNIHDAEVLKKHHALIFELLDKKVFDGLRIDHIDGLFDPEKYLHELRKHAGKETYIVVEKITERHEQLPGTWPVQGTTGYDFLALVNNLFTHKKAEEIFTGFYKQMDEDVDLQEQIYQKKSLILHEYMSGDLENLYQLLLSLNFQQVNTLKKEAVKKVIADFLIHFPVYRFYGNKFPLEKEELHAIKNIFEEIRNKNSSQAVEVLYNIFINTLLGDAEQNIAVSFYQRCMQFSGPLMAKGVEDTLMYTYNKFIAHNDVGDAPGAFGISVDEFHQHMMLRQKHWHLAMNATATHDTKRGEDVRARLNVLTDIPDDWLQIVQQWMNENKSLKKNDAPALNDEYLIYQSLIGHFPFDEMESKNFGPRLKDFIVKALREAKTNSSWSKPDETYESAAQNFAVALLQSEKFMATFQKLLNQISDHGIVNSLSQLVLKFTCPGIPDVYQGTETWDFSFVDPDNRRPVDYALRKKIIADLENGQHSLNGLWENRNSGQIKSWLIYKLANLRKQNPDFWANAEYLPLQTSGQYKDHVMAFARMDRNECYVIAVPMHTVQLHDDFFQINWKDTSIHLPKNIESPIENISTGKKISAEENLSVQGLFKEVPFAILKANKLKQRGAGILLHLTSLPSDYGIGDPGPVAKRFVDFLHNSHQQYWQLLPINPTEAAQGYSPYSASSSRAGYPLLISPEMLANEGLLSKDDLKTMPVGHQINYSETEKIKKQMLHLAYQNFLQQEAKHVAFEEFIKVEKDWLDDFALYTFLKNKFRKPWYEWPTAYKMRAADALKKIGQEPLVHEIKWQQYIFFSQWKDLKEYCTSKRIKLIGDLPIYVSYDSADVWAHREIFAIDETGNRTGIAGVPPDAFSDDGQLWGMPVFKWDVLKQQDYRWWKERIRKNLELFHLIRIDHFRAFAAYWEVPPGEQTAKNGTWKKGPSSHFFNSIKKEFPNLPLIAEDLGDVNEEVFSLRDEFDLAGMKVLQFSFGDDLPESLHSPHNYSHNFLVYTGTHDNNTVRGWWRQDASKDVKKRLQEYTSQKINEKNVADVFIKMAYASVAKTAIVPMQDLLNMDESARMNVPSSPKNNWVWRMRDIKKLKVVQQKLSQWLSIYNR